MSNITSSNFQPIMDSLPITVKPYKRYLNNNNNNIYNQCFTPTAVDKDA